MEVAHLVLEYLQVLIWPSVLILAFFMFREPLVSLINQLKSAELPGGVLLDFDKEVREVEHLSREVANTPRKEAKASTPMLPITEANARMLALKLQPSPSGLDLQRYRDLAQQDPNLALAGLRMEVEILARNLAKGFSLALGSHDTAGTLLRRLLDNGAITSFQFELAGKIVRLCNAAVHGTQVSLDEAESIIESATVLAKDYLKWLSWGFDDDWKPHGDKNIT
ncbi:hypothetical protein Mal35_23300 [Gimesia maris]|uniref:hypothetical protein n=1 Tax=Gimesia maris TaxID=122 RepID=UPI00118C639B|nr:hypothetical protein [Gimesia maris]QDT78879.1 hypothetical protein Mal35_23300 [Gimesia maris]